MAISDNRVRVSICPTKEQCARIDAMASRLGMSRSATCSMLLATALESYEAMATLPPDKLTAVVNLLK